MKKSNALDASLMNDLMMIEMSKNVVPDQAEYAMVRRPVRSEQTVRTSPKQLVVPRANYAKLDNIHVRLCLV